MNVKRRIDWLLETLFPTPADDLMAVADATGVTHIDEPIPYTLTDRIPFEETTEPDDDQAGHAAVCRAVEQMAAVRANTPAGVRDWDLWTSEVLS